MVLVCECDHPRSEHEGGKVIYNDYRVENCKHQDCTCKHYHADKKTRKRKNELLLAVLTIPFLISGLCLVGFIISWVIIDFTFQDYIITSEIEYKVFENGVEVDRTTVFGGMPIEPHERLAYNMKMLIGMIFMIIGMFSSLFYVVFKHESKYFELIRGESD